MSVARTFTTETFEPMTGHGGRDDADGRGARYLDWVWDPDPSDTWALTEYAFLLREADGSVDVVHETHRSGLFRRDVWLRLLRELTAGMPNAQETEFGNLNVPQFFVAHRPTS